MEPSFWQLRNRIKYVERLRSGVDHMVHGYWETVDDNPANCGVCAVGAVLRTMRGVGVRNKRGTFVCFAGGTYQRGAREYITAYKDPERMGISDFLGLNYLEIRQLSDKYEGEGQYRGRCSTTSEIASWFENKHVTQYLYKIERHFPRIQQNVREEIKAEAQLV